ncbi:hypothetical protein EC957_005952 [Mortierella hygrophila]|uniref:Uncharacterized protein n=1 Tax=Mortierella hygrophila TaxID=979708 RepID=A0A9P6F0C4_9FUNG|nr:hypothetical protein EC957_005952 [Mortierella hygrophila]
MDYILQTWPHLQTLQLNHPLLFRCMETRSSSLESSLEITPLLKPLQLRNLRRQDSEENYNLVSLALPLQSIHFSVFRQQAAEGAEEVIEKVLVICAQTTEWSFPSSDLTPFLKQCRQELPNVLTTLNQVTDSVNQTYNAPALHQYLYEPLHLLHSKPGQSSSLIEKMDLFGRWMNPPRHGENAYRQPGIWMCCKLETLQIEVHNLGSPAHQTLIAKERQREQERLDFVVKGEASGFVAPQGVEPAQVQVLWNLGLLVYVKLMEEQMNSDEGYEGPPRLRSLSSYSGSQKRLA